MKKLLSMLLAFCMVVSLVAPVAPVHAYAAEADEEPSVVETDEPEVVEPEEPEVVEPEEPEVVEPEEPEVVEPEEPEVVEPEEPEVVEPEEPEVVEPEEPEVVETEEPEDVESEDEAVEPEEEPVSAPAKPEASNTVDTFDVTVYGEDELAVLDWNDERLSVTVGEPEMDADGIWWCDVTIDAASYVRDLIAELEDENHLFGMIEGEDYAETVSLVWGADFNQWLVPEGTAVEFALEEHVSDAVTYEAPTDPEISTTENGCTTDASSYYNNSYIHTKVIDGEKGVQGGSEWAPASGQALNSWVTLSWTAPQTVTAIEVYGRATSREGVKEHPLEVEIVFNGDEASKQVVTADANNEMYPAVLDLAAPVENVTSIKFTITEIEGTELAGFDEIEVYGYVSENAHTHTWGEWTETKAPTCTEAGEQTRTCSGCNETETQTVAATGHTDADNNGACDVCEQVLKCAAPTNEFPSGDYSEAGSVYFKPTTTTEGAKIKYRVLESATDSQNKWYLFQGSRTYTDVTVVEAYAYMEDGSLADSDVVTFTYVFNLPDQKCGDNLTWKLSADTKTLTIEGTGDMYNYASYDSGAEPWTQRFSQYVLRNITTLVLPEGITSIGDYAFGRCYGLVGDLIIPDGVTYIGNNAFGFNKSETGHILELPDSLVTIGDWAFGNNKFTGTLTIPSGVTSIGANAFKQCDGFTGDLVLPEGLKTIGQNAFAQCYGFNGRLVIPGSVETIGSYAFDGFSTTPVHYTGMEYGACQGKWDALWTAGSISNTNKVLAGFVDGGNVTYGDHTDADGDSICDDCGATIEIPHDCSDPMKDADGFCDICGKCLHSTSGDKDYCWRGYCQHGECCVKACGENLRWHYSDGDHGTVIITGTGDMWDYATTHGTSKQRSPWIANPNVTGVQFPDGITRIGDNAFNHTYSSANGETPTDLVGTLEIPGSVKSIGAKAFCNQIKITGLTLNEGLEEIGSGAFEATNGGSALSGKLTLPSTVKTIGSRAFYKLTGLNGQLVLPAALETIGGSAFYGCTGFTGLTVIPANVTKIDQSAFNGCTGIEIDLNLPEGLATIGSSALKNTVLNGKLYIPKTLTKLDYGNFPATSGITSVEYGGCNMEEFNTNLPTGTQNRDKFNWLGNDALINKDTGELNLLATMTFAHVGGTPEDGTCDICGKVFGHDCADTNGDGFCDVCNTCLHTKDGEGYCTAENCTHDETCCPKAPIVISGDLPGEILANTYASYSNVGGQGHWNGNGMGYLTIGDEFVYNVNVTEDITQSFFVNAASNNDASEVTVFVDGVEKFSMTLPKTPGDSWNTYEEVVGPELTLTQGVHTITVRVDNNNFNFHSFGTKAVEPAVYYDLPGTVMGLDYASANTWYGRPVGGPDGENSALGGLEPGDTFVYNVNATEDFELLFGAKVATDTNLGAAGFAVYVDDEAAPRFTMDLPATGGWDAYQDVTGPALNLTQGQHTITVEVTGKMFNLYSFYTKEMVALEAPVASPAGGSYDAAQSVTLTCAAEGAEIYYSVDGSDPSILYMTPIAISSDTTLKFVAKMSGWLDSEVVTEVYDIAEQLKCGDELYYEINNGTLRIYGTGAMWDFADMESAPWYGERLNIKALVLEEGITHMGNNAFADEGLANVMNAYPIAGTLTLPTTLTTIGDYAFAYLSGTDGKGGVTGELKLPAGLTSIGEAAFKNTAGFTGDLIIPESCLILGAEAFNNFNRRARVTFTGKLVLPEGITVLPNSVFNACDFTEANIPHSVEAMGSNVFLSDTLQKVTYLDGCECEWRLIKDTNSSYGNGYRSGSLSNLLDEGKIEFHAHELDGLGWHTSVTYHWHTCIRTDDSMMVDQALHTYPEDDHNCTTALACDVCGYEKVAAADHTWGEWVVTTEPTETEKGEETRTCSACDATETREIPALGHTHDGVTFEEFNPVDFYNGGSWKMVGGFWVADSYVDAIVDGNWTLPADMNLCLNDNTLWMDKTGPFAGEYNIVVPEGITLNIYDCSGGIEGRIIGEHAGFLTVDGGTVNIYGGSIVADGAGQVIVNSGELNLFGGKITSDDGLNGTTSDDCVVVVNGGTVNVSGGTVEATGVNVDFETGDKVGAIGVRVNGGKLNITGGTFETEGSNIAVSAKNAIDVTDYTANLTVALEGEWADGDVIANGVTSADQFTVTGAETALKGSQLVVVVHTHAFGEWIVTKAPTCTEKGTETRSCECGETETREIAALGHDYGKPEWTWTADFAATATFTCANDASHVETVAGTVTSEITTEPGAATPGERTYTATVTFNETEYTATTTEEIPALGHTHDGGITYDRVIDAADTEWVDGNYYLNAETNVGYVYARGNVNLCLNGNTLNVQKIYVDTNANLTICDCGTGGKIVGKYAGVIVVKDKGTLNLENGEVSSTSTSTTGATIELWAPTGTYGGGTVNISGGTVIGKGKGIFIKDQCTDAVVNVTGGTICAGTEAGISANTGKINISGGDVERVQVNYSSGVTAHGIVTVSGGNIHNEDSTISSAVYVMGGEAIIMDGANITSVTNGIRTAVIRSNTTYNPKLKVSGGSINGTESDIQIDGKEQVNAQGYTGETLTMALASGTTLTDGDIVVSNVSDAALFTGIPMRLDGTNLIYGEPAHEHAFGEWTVTTPATCTEKGTETRSCECGETETREIAALGHDYGKPEWTWTADFAATATFTCANDASHVETVAGTVTSEITTEPGAATPGERTYTATVTFNGIKYTATTTEEIPALGYILRMEESVGSTIQVDGVPYTGTLEDGQYVFELPDGDRKIVTTYEYKISEATGKPYPSGMKVWMLDFDDPTYTATPVDALENFLKYEGVSIRTSDPKGIRVISSVPTEGKAQLIEGTLAGMTGYTLKEYGTLVEFEKVLGDKPLTLDTTDKKATAYSKEDGKDAIFKTLNGRVWYTNTLVNFSYEMCKQEIAMRPYMTVVDAEGNEVVIYGGTVVHSIGNIAWANRYAFDEGTDQYNYIWDIINHVYGENLPG